MTGQHTAYEECCAVDNTFHARSLQMVKRKATPIWAGSASIKKAQ